MSNHRTFCDGVARRDFLRAGAAGALGLGLTLPDLLARRTRAAERGGADYVGFGAMFPTPTKQDAEYAGPALLAKARARVRLPLVAIGGITAQNAAEVLAARPDWLAVVSAVSAATNV